MRKYRITLSKLRAVRREREQADGVLYWVLVIGFFLWAYGSAFASSGASFLKLPVGARAIAMGNSYTAIANDVSAIHWNPAGLMRIQRKELGLMHAQLFAGTQYNFVGYSRPLQRSNTYSLRERVAWELDHSGTRMPEFKPADWSMGVGALYLSHGSIDGRDSSGSKTGDFSASDVAFNMALARKVSNRSDFGVNLKVIRQVIDTDEANGFAMDMGIIRRAPRLIVGLAFQNIGPSMKFNEQSYSLPFTVATGLGYHLRKGVMLTADYKFHPVDGTTSLGFGGEMTLMSRFFLRGGYLSTLKFLQKSGTSEDLKIQQQLSGLGMGFGIRLFNSRIDYALTPMGELGITQRVSLTFRFR